MPAAVRVLLGVVGLMVLAGAAAGGAAYGFTGGLLKLIAKYTQGAGDGFDEPKGR